MRNNPRSIIAIVPAAGIGSRMGADKPKQYLMLGQQSILAHTLDTLFAHPEIEQVIVALHPQDHYFSQLPQSQHPKLIQVVGGGERADSVLAALDYVYSHHPDAWALVHDAARPCVTLTDISRLIESVDIYPQGAILAAPVRDTMKRSDASGHIVNTVDRTLLWHALTPQFFPASILRRHLSAALAAQAPITDEASAMEWAGVMPGLVSGRVDNIKVTHPDDLQLAVLFMSQQ
ncbi:2-C-methyl-D-erythritol 4-phosphate cytidylyltransferase [Shewanella sp. SR43-4]|jgi:2-C-methyl-D-erythritol 4-phosphate cytidylyltransferase|uniref:2-C-methyl-D-erythritol 4-phosphate cytidylyltransferase n=1 Tax=Shewanella vesiculosa TaxID=518738 RepID=A0ABV0FMU4_9GAMM|nr:MULTISPECIES: 2-C-methyl-D-erythritol 4-phosphate cytidylyltransferase [unclassified Shewanella]MBB1318032.1 2-C-methyl-D-erythritol 4-phosphate cytidylyltransferase [Shewanella sp. SR43-4]MBB1388701.1 2-C-methyl-D-erythritol 4-phosphate cytidylyltransferase [Shewanella sp. SG44-6]MBB1474740.1 2-C-methyl-D-erythritol 4-phosphate cytidylyltransferase [Shewanella sp. SG41-3]|tara:strand:- start:4062 stop:4760 length:699 start_codon:yes stop_codon:yes gene_type:complete